MAKPDRVLDGQIISRKWALAFGRLILIGVIWGLAYSIAKLLTEDGAPAIGVAWLSAITSAVFLSIYCFVRQRPPPISTRHLEAYAIAGTFGGAAPAIVLYTSASQLPAGILAIVSSLTSLVTYLLSLGVRLETFSVQRIIGILFGFTAIGAIALPKTGLPEPSMAYWVLITLLIPLFYSVENTYLALRRPQVADSLVLLCGMMWFVGLVMTPLVLSTEAMSVLDHLTIKWSVLLVAVCLANIIAYATLLDLIERSGPVFAAQSGYLVTAFGVLWGIAIFGERHSLWVWSAFALMLVGLSLVNPLSNRKIVPSHENEST